MQCFSLNQIHVSRSTNKHITLNIITSKGPRNGPLGMKMSYANLLVDVALFFQLPIFFKKFEDLR